MTGVPGPTLYPLISTPEDFQKTAENNENHLRGFRTLYCKTSNPPRSRDTLKFTTEIEIHMGFLLCRLGWLVSF